MSFDVKTAAEEWLINFCQGVKIKDEMTGGHENGKQVFKISDGVVVKIGHGETAAEAAIQKFAYHNVNPSIVRVPRFYRFFQDKPDPSWPVGYPFTEYISGPTLKNIDLEIHTDIVQRMTSIIAHLGQIRGGKVPRPLESGTQNGYLWSEINEKPVFHSVEDMNTWLNKRLVIRTETIDLRPHPLVLCHMDLCRRNMILNKENNSIYLIDWGFAGFYPRLFEVAAISCLNHFNKPYDKPVLRATETLLKLTEEEKRSVKQILIARHLTLRYPGLDE